MRTALSIVIVLALLVGVVFGVQIVVANRSAPTVFGPNFCWLEQGDDITNIRTLRLAKQGSFIPNPVKQVNRRLFGIGLDDPEVLSPHFAILAFDETGAPRVAAWSYRQMSFWTEPEDLLLLFAPGGLRDACRARFE